MLLEGSEHDSVVIEDVISHDIKLGSMANFLRQGLCIFETLRMLKDQSRLSAVSWSKMRYIFIARYQAGFR